MHRIRRAFPILVSGFQILPNPLLFGTFAKILKWKPKILGPTGKYFHLHFFFALILGKLFKTWKLFENNGVRQYFACKFCSHTHVSMKTSVVIDDLPNSILLSMLRCALDLEAGGVMGKTPQNMQWNKCKKRDPGKINSQKFWELFSPQNYQNCNGLICRWYCLGEGVGSRSLFELSQLKKWVPWSTHMVNHVGIQHGLLHIIQVFSQQKKTWKREEHSVLHITKRKRTTQKKWHDKFAQKVEPIKCITFHYATACNATLCQNKFTT